VPERGLSAWWEAKSRASALVDLLPPLSPLSSLWPVADVPVFALSTLVSRSFALLPVLFLPHLPLLECRRELLQPRSGEEARLEVSYSEQRPSLPILQPFATVSSSPLSVLLILPVRPLFIFSTSPPADPSRAHTGRQISGIGGGVSSLSKAAIIGVPGEGEDGQEANGRLPGSTWADEGRREGMGEWDIVYRFAQVGVKQPVLDW
jgi:hypothetical protein